MDEYQVHNIALKTLKQRCEYLQQRLNAVEEENYKLKLEKAQDSNIKTGTNSSEEQIILLKKENSQMAHKIRMITDENFTLWSQLSKLYPGNSLSNLKLSVGSVPDNQIPKPSQKESPDDYSTESLEEISLKLINGIIMGKNELEKQYSQMIDLQKENLPEEKVSFLPHFDNRTTVKNFKDYVQKLKDFKQALYKQRNELSSAISVLKNSQNNPKQTINVNLRDISNSNYLNHNVASNLNVNQLCSDFSTLQDFGKSDSGEMVCPMCGKSFTGMYTIFYAHVTEHFEEDNEEFVDARTNFEGFQ